MKSKRIQTTLRLSAAIDKLVTDEAQKIGVPKNSFLALLIHEAVTNRKLTKSKTG